MAPGNEHDDDADRYELDVRRRDARRTLTLGIVGVIVSLALFAAVPVWAVLAMNADRGSFRVLFVLLACGGLIGLGGLRAILSGLRARKASKQFEERLRDATSKSALSAPYR